MITRHRLAAATFIVKSLSPKFSHIIAKLKLFAEFASWATNEGEARERVLRPANIRRV